MLRLIHLNVKIKQNCAGFEYTNKSPMMLWNIQNCAGFEYSITSWGTYWLKHSNIQSARSCENLDPQKTFLPEYV